MIISVDTTVLAEYIASAYRPTRTRCIPPHTKEGVGVNEIECALINKFGKKRCPECGAKLVVTPVAEHCSKVKWSGGRPDPKGPCRYALMSG